MIILSSNFRGLGDPLKRSDVKDFFQLNKADGFCFQQSKLDNIDNAILRSLGGNNLVDWDYINAIGSTSGIMAGWKGYY